MSAIYISMGSNINPVANLRSATETLQRCFQSVVISPVYQSPAEGMVADDFLNAAAGAETNQPIEEVIRQLRAIEDSCHRDRSQPRFSSRTLDLDLLLYDDVVIQTAELTLPRADITESAFVLQPLADIAAELQHPVAEKSLTLLLRELRRDHPQRFMGMRQVDDRIQLKGSSTIN